MTDMAQEVLKLIAYAGLIVGVFGTVAPVVPGPPLIWLSALLWAWADGFARVGWPTLVVMGLLALLAMVVDLLLTTYGGRRSGVAWRSLGASALAALAGFLLFNLLGAVIGAVAGLLVAEAVRHGGDWQAAWRTSRGAIAGYLVATVAQVVLVLLMVFVFTIQAFGP